VQIARQIKKESQSLISELKAEGITPKLAAVQTGENESSRIYTKQQKKACQNSGIEYDLHILPDSSSEEELIGHIRELNDDRSVTGIILQLPLPAGLDPVKIQSEIVMQKDVEGANPAHLGWITCGEPKLIPCTAAAVIKILESTGVNPYGKEAVMVGHSNIVGKPAALILLNKFATVSICHIATGESGLLPDYVKKAEILIVSVGKANFVKGEWVRRGAVVIDVGINMTEQGITGDVEYEKAFNKAGWITPVPGGVGPVTTAMLVKNTAEASKAAVGRNKS
jgi:methylenetetrahydrofolate dehydrogenase (NADP+) / methenyltetrahydrofolate cyclohydrolase